MFRRAALLALILSVLSADSVLAGTLTLPFAESNPRITAWVDHHYPTRQEDGIMIRFDGATTFPYDGHRGTDFAVPSDTPIVAADEGTVVYADWSDTGGWGVVVEHSVIRTAYFHNNRLLVYPGQHVSRGQLLALSGSTGNSTGPHLHFEVRDLLDPWHAVDPFGWTAPGPDPWHWDMGYLWSTDPPTPVVLPLAFFGGARWNYWYGLDSAPPAVTWQIRDGINGFSGYATKWDADPGPNAPRTASRQGSITLPGPGSHTMHLRVFDAGGNSADVTYLYRYDVGRPVGDIRLAPPHSTAVPVVWKAHDDLSGVEQIAIEVRDDPGKPFRPWTSKGLETSSSDAAGALRFFGEPGTQYELRLTVRNAARNASVPLSGTIAIPAAAPRPPSAADRLVLGSLPEPPPGFVTASGVRQEHPLHRGTVLLSADGTVHGMGGERSQSLTPPTAAVPIDFVVQSGGTAFLLTDGTIWNGQTGPSQRFKTSAPLRLLKAGNGRLLTVDTQQGVIAGDTSLGLSPPLPVGVALVDGAAFGSGNGGITLDSDGRLHAFGDAASVLTAIPNLWPLAGSPAGIALSGGVRAPAGLLLDANGERYAFGSLLLLSEALFAGPTFDPQTGLVVR